MSMITTFLSRTLCSGSTRRLIAGWWYSILALSLAMTLISIWVMSSRSRGEGFSSIWASVMMVILSIVGTMIMRRFHNSLAVGFFLGSIVASAQLFFVLFIVYIYYGQQRKLFNNESFVEITMGCLFLLQSILLGIFSVILGSHSTEILDRHGSGRIKQTFSDFSAVSTSSPSNNQYTPPVFE